MASGRTIVTEKSLEPEIPAGAEVLWEEVRSLPENGDLIVYIPTGEIPVFRKFFLQNDGRVLLNAVNPSFRSYSCTKEDFLNRGRIGIILSMTKIFPAARRFQDAGTPEIPGTKENEFLTLREAMELLKVRRTRMYEMLRSGELKAVKLGKLWRIDRQSVQALLHHS